MRLSKAHNLNLRDGDVIYYPNFLNKNEAEKYFKYLRNNLEWQQDKITVFGNCLYVRNKNYFASYIENEV